jgi:hypothetical protein
MAEAPIFLHSLDHLITIRGLAAGGARRRQKWGFPMPGDHIAHKHRRGEQMRSDGQ